MKTHVGIDTKSIKNQNIQLHAYLERKNTFIYVWCTLAISLVSLITKVTSQKTGLCFGFFNLLLLLFPARRNRLWSKYHCLYRSECQWEIQGIPLSVLKEDLCCTQSTISCCKCERLPAPRLWMGRKWIWSKLNIFLRPLTIFTSCNP